MLRTRGIGEVLRLITFIIFCIWCRCRSCKSWRVAAPAECIRWFSCRIFPEDRRCQESHERGWYKSFICFRHTSMFTYIWITLHDVYDYQMLSWSSFCSDSRMFCWNREMQGNIFTHCFASSLRKVSHKSKFKLLSRLCFLDLMNFLEQIFKWQKFDNIC